MSRQVSDQLSGRVCWRPERKMVVAAVELRDVVKTYGSVTAVAGVSLRLEPRELLTLLGPSGCGKTTLMNMVAGFFPPSSGDILIEGRSVLGLPPYRRNIGMVFQSYALFPHMSVTQNVAFGLEEQRLPRDEIRASVTEALRMVRLADLGDRRPSELSGGQQQRVALARALVVRPKVLLLDEPLSALDKNLRAHMQIEIKQIQRQAGVAAIFVTHDQSEALSLSDRIAVMSAGRVEQIGTPQEIYGAPASGFVAAFIGETNRIPGSITRNDHNEVIIDIASGARLIAPTVGGSACSVGSSVNVFVRPEDIAIVEAGDDSPNVLAAEVIAFSYQGSHTQVIANVAGLGPISVLVAGSDVIQRHPVGNRVQLELDLSRASILLA
jgi:spermidine/putrescine ABC transporter ATP-binding subunit